MRVLRWNRSLGSSTCSGLPVSLTNGQCTVRLVSTALAGNTKAAKNTVTVGGERLSFDVGYLLGTAVPLTSPPKS